MSDAVGELIREIAIKHGIAVGRDDPLMILQTINQRLLDDGTKAQQQMLGEFKQELEGISQRWSTDSREKAERTLNAAVNVSKELIVATAREGAAEIANVVKREVESALQAAHANSSESRNLSKLNIAAACLSIVAASIALVVSMAR